MDENEFQSIDRFFVSEVKKINKFINVTVSDDIKELTTQKGPINFLEKHIFLTACTRIDGELKVRKHKARFTEEYLRSQSIERVAEDIRYHVIRTIGDYEVIDPRIVLEYRREHGLRTDRI